MPYPHHLHEGAPYRPCPVCRNFVATNRKVQLIEIILLKEEIYHDIDAETHQLQKMRTAANVTAGSPAGPYDTLPLSTDNNNRYLIDRYIDRYVSQAVTRLTAYLALPSPFAHRVANNHAKEWEEKSIYVALPHDWPPHHIEPLRDAVHQLIVKGVEYQLLAVALPKDTYTALCREMMEEADADITVHVNARYTPQTCGYSPFG